ncbi:type B 50S ribosomal protein L31 [Neptuniibacter caesariensis]|uniref:Large ribosomal subunit protein bL31B n=1 Tax=Neptuniibacter caesariensis TaxID=207954 RepID=A0A7U8C8N5_NEPCE|nr:type B 50S ribosomal protein L31 [Neptuniibacter caesariensis]EAR61881.1 ribosomal protein, L31P family protein [Oceanospirillum sp. MED92] [Neptuniibacter caesariensis]
MKKGIHPDYDYVIFRDTSCGRDFRIRSTCKSDQTVVWEDGKTYPLVTLDVSSASHPTYTGEKRQAKAEGRIAQFNKRFGNRASRSQ